MTTEPRFDSTRSSAIRDLLVETVDSSSGRRPVRVLVSAALAALAVLLAGGTAALALTGVIRFGDPEPVPPAPTPTATPSAAPTSTPTPTPEKIRPLIQTTPIQPHDVLALPETPKWTLDLAGGNPECTDVRSFDLSDGRALYLSGLRQEFIGEAQANACLSRGENIVLTLVDTEQGSKLWERQWSFRPESLGSSVDLMVLGTSGRAIVSYDAPQIGPHEVINLETGQTVGDVQGPRGGLRNSARPVADTSGDIISISRSTDANGNTVSNDVLSRIDPLHPESPKWTTTLPGRGSTILPAVDSAIAVPVSYYPNLEADSVGVLVDAETGELGPATSSIPSAMSDAYVQLPARWDEGKPVTMTAQDAHGTSLWSKSIPGTSTVEEVRSPSTIPGITVGIANAGTGMFVVVGAGGSQVTLVDQRTGNELWTAQTRGGCERFNFNFPGSVLDLTRNAIVVGPNCSFDRTTGDQLPADHIPVNGWTVLGVSVVYGYNVFTAEGGTAYDLTTGDVLWRRARPANELWGFAGGYLVSRHGNHLEALG